MLLDLAIKATVLLAIGFALSYMLRHGSAASRHTVWTTVFVAMLLLPVARLVMPEWAVVSVPDRISRLGLPTLRPSVTTDIRPAGYYGRRRFENVVSLALQVAIQLRCC